jgi:hypothetical protein
MKTRVILALLALALLAGCGDRRLVIDIDVLSYVSPADRGQPFGPIPAVPPDGAYLPESPLIDDQEVRLLEGLTGLATVQAVTISANIFHTSTSGTGSDTLRLYLSPDDVPARTTPPVFERAFTFTPGLAESTRVEVGGDARVVDLFNSRRFRFSVTTALRGPASGPALSGLVSIHELHCVVVSSRKPL